MERLQLTTLPKTWIFDLDGTICVHNGYRTEAGDHLLPGVKAYLDQIQPEDKIIILTSRKEKFRAATVSFLRDNKIRYDEILFDMPMGERVVINDRKPSGADMAVGININRDEFCMPEIEKID